MCDYSLNLVASRPARVGDKLVTTRFPNSITRGFASVDDPKVAICLLPGTELAFDPGYRVVAEAAARGIPVEVLPGAGAVTTALVLSGLPTSSYTFKGFPPRKPGPRQRFLEAERDAPHTLILFESPYRVGKLLACAAQVLGNRRAAVCIELTKKFEAVHRGFLEDLAERFAVSPIRGEVTVVIAGSNPKFSKSVQLDKTP